MNFYTPPQFKDAQDYFNTIKNLMAATHCSECGAWCGLKRIDGTRPGNCSCGKAITEEPRTE